MALRLIYKIENRPYNIEEKMPKLINTSLTYIKIGLKS